MNPGADGRQAMAVVTTAARGVSRTRRALAWGALGPGEDDDARTIAASAVGGAVTLPTTLRELTALVRRARLVIAGDTGPLHIAAAVGTPCLGLYGPTSATRNGPYGPGHRVLQSADGRTASITPTSALEAATALLEAA